MAPTKQAAGSPRRPTWNVSVCPHREWLPTGCRNHSESEAQELHNLLRLPQLVFGSAGTQTSSGSLDFEDKGLLSREAVS